MQLQSIRNARFISWSMVAALIWPKPGNNAAEKGNIVTNQLSSFWRIVFWNYLWIVCLPTLVIPKCFLTICVALWLKTPSTHMECNFLNLVIVFFQMRCQFLQMQLLFVGHPNTAFFKYAEHVTFQFGIFMYFTIAEFYDCFYNNNRKTLNSFETS